MKLAVGRESTGIAAAEPRAQRDVVVVSLAAVTWGFRLVGRTRMLTEAWAALEQPTVFVQVPSYRTALERLASPLSVRRLPVPVVRPWPTYPSHWWPSVGTAGLHRAVRNQARALRKQLDRHVDWKRAVALVVSPVWAPWLAELPFAQIVYDCIDDLAVHIKRPGLAPLFHAWEQELVERADGAAVTAERLGVALHARRPELPIALIRNGVNVERFQALAAERPRPADVPRRGRPVIGFVGALYEWIDWDLIDATVRALPHCDFVFVGPSDGRGQVERIAAHPNARFTGPRAYAEVPAYVQAFDVCWVPFKQDEIGTAANPVKIYEYLALGKPVVSTPVADMDGFGELVIEARDAASMRASLAGAYERRVWQVEERVAFAERNTWAQRAQDYLDFVASLSPARC